MYIFQSHANPTDCLYFPLAPSSKFTTCAVVFVFSLKCIYNMSIVKKHAANKFPAPMK